MHHSAAVPHNSYYRIPPQARITGDFLQHRSRQDLDLKISTPASDRDPQNGSYRRGQEFPALGGGIGIGQSLVATLMSRQIGLQANMNFEDTAIGKDLLD